MWAVADSPWVGRDGYVQGWRESARNGLTAMAHVGECGNEDAGSRSVAGGACVV